MNDWKWPERVWEATGTSPTGKTLWSSRMATSEDYERRAEVERLVSGRWENEQRTS